MRTYSSDLCQHRGGGVGDVFSNIYRTLRPYAEQLMKVVKAAAKTKQGQRVIQATKRGVMQAGVDAAHDILSGEPVVKSAKKRARERARKSRMTWLTSLRP